MSVRTYNPSVRVGNWNEDIQLQEDQLKEFLARKERGELLIQKSTSLVSAVSKKVDLSISRDGNIHFGDVVMIVNPCTKDKTRNQCALAMGVSANSSAGTTTGVAGTFKAEPSARTAFFIASVSPDSAGTRTGDCLRYGHPFYLCMGGEEVLYLHSDVLSFQKCAKKSRHHEVMLVSEASHLTEWKFLPFDPQFRLELEGHPVPANSKVILVHSKTNQNLCLEAEHMIRSPFGMEAEISGHTSLDSHKAENDVNHWVVVTAERGETLQPPPKVENPPTPAGSTQG